MVLILDHVWRESKGEIEERAREERDVASGVCVCSGEVGLERGAVCVFR